MSKKNVALLIATNRCTMNRVEPCSEVPKLSSFRLVVLLVDDTLTIEFRIGGQLPLVISFRAVILFVMSGAGFTLSNFNTDASDSKLSGRIVPMIKAFAIILC